MPKKNIIKQEYEKLTKDIHMRAESEMKNIEKETEKIRKEAEKIGKDVESSVTEKKR